MGDHRKTLTRLATLTTLSRNAGEGYDVFNSKLLSRTAGEGGPSPKGLVGEGAPAPRGNNNPRALKGVPNGFRIRVGDWRVSYTLDYQAGVMSVFEIAPRGGAYR